MFCIVLFVIAQTNTLHILLLLSYIAMEALETIRWVSWIHHSFFLGKSDVHSNKDSKLFESKTFSNLYIITNASKIISDS